MTGEPWLYVAFVLLVALHVLSLVAFAMRSRGRLESSTDRRTRPDEAASVGGRSDHGVEGATRIVDCPECGATNEEGYRFCRSCVAPIPGADDRVLGGNPARAGELE